MGSEKFKQHHSLSMWVLVSAMLFQSFLTPLMATTSFEDQKNYYSPDPRPRTPPSGSYGSPPLVPTPSHGPSPPHGGGSHGGSHGGGSYGGSPPAHSTPSNPSPSNGNCGTPPSTPLNPPSGGGGGYYPSPPTGGHTPTPVTPTTPTTPYVPTPSTPSVPTPPTPTPYVPSPPLIPDPNSPFTCNYWRTHPGLIWAVLGWWGTLGNTFGVTSVPGSGTSMSLQQALANTRPDGYGALYREGTAALLNSMATKNFAFTTRQVRANFISALGSNKAAAAQGHVFKLANEGKLKPRN